MLRSLIIGMMMVGTTMPAMAADTDRLAQRQLQQQLQTNPDDPVVMAQLARMYLLGGRADKAAGLYKGMLSVEEVMLERKGGPAISSHALAQRALKTLETSRPIQLGSR